MGQEINGAVLAAMERDDFKEIGVLSGLHIKRLSVKLKHCRMRLERDLERARAEEDGEYVYSDESTSSTHHPTTRGTPTTRRARAARRVRRATTTRTTRAAAMRS